MTSKHTPGPWTAEKDYESDWIINGANGSLLAIIEGWTDEIDKADAHLIAAAPEMYEALKALRVASGKLPADLKKCPEMVGCLIEADAAIAKAEGKP